jgi:hypothetical protein
MKNREIMGKRKITCKIVLRWSKKRGEKQKKEKIMEREKKGKQAKRIQKINNRKVRKKSNGRICKIKENGGTNDEIEKRSQFIIY